MAQAFFGGVHPNDMKAATNEKAIEQLEAPAEVVIPMSMHIGAPCKPIVAVGDKVTIGQKIGEPGGFVSAPIHASVSGTVKAVEPRPFSMGGTMMSVVIENDFQNTVCPDIHPVEDPDSLTPEQLVEIVKNAGIVGQGGATFPTHVKISSGLGKVDYVIINAAECEPYITGDHRTMLERPEQVVKGATLLAKCFGVEHVYIGIEANKQNAADVLNKTIAELNAPVVVEVLHTRYPQGAEKQLCQAVSGRQVPSGKLPADAGCCIFNLNTTCAIYRAVYTGMPVVNKIVTVSGSGVIEPKNIECPIGTPISKLFDACGGLREDTYKLIMGGPMMGLAQYNVDVTVGKGTGAMLAFAGKEEQYEEHPQCIRCGKCVGVCPMRLEPVFMYKYLMKGDVDTWQNTLHGMDCIECGACTYICPARLPLIHAFRMGKQKVNNARMAAKAKAEAYSAEAVKCGGTLRVHIKVDTGMSRLGFLVRGEHFETGVEAIAESCALPGLDPEGIFTHFAVSDMDGADYEAYTREQFGVFTHVLDALAAKGRTFRIRHCANSGALTRYPEMYLDMVRPGIALYGVGDDAERLGLRPVMRLKSCVSTIKVLDPDTTVSYGRTFRTEGKTRMGVLPIGYADGFFRGLSNRMAVQTAYGPAPQRGRICMDMCMVDLTDLPEVKVGDTVEIFGQTQSVDSLAAILNTIPYELTCAVSKRVPRVYIEGGKIVERSLRLL